MNTRKPSASVTSVSTYDLVRDARRARRRRHLRLWWRALRIVGGLWLLLIVATVCASLFIPCHISFKCRSRQSEAKTNLKSLYVHQQVFREENDRYGSLEEIRFAPRGPKPGYMYEVTLVERGRYTATATGIRPGQIVGDRWQVTELGLIKNIDDSCAR